MKEQPVSIAIPTLNRGQALLDTVDSLLTHGEGAEILVVDQTSNHPQEIEERLGALNDQGRIRWLKLEEPSIPRAMNVALRSAVNACRLLETQFAQEGPLTFSRREFELFINDRALAPNTPETYSACRPELDAFLSSVLGHDEFSLEHNSDPRCRFGVVVNVAKPFELTAILAAR